MLKDRQAYEAKLDEQFAKWDADIEALKARARDASVDGMIKYDETVETLKRKKAEAGVHLARLKASGDDTWEQVKAGLDTAWDEVKALFGHTTGTPRP